MVAIYAALAVFLGASPGPDHRTPVLVELFTSEGCSSCPPAEALLRRVVDEQPVAGARIVALSEHVDYWNDLGWRDPFSDAAFTRRQQRYVRRLGLSGAYTPQAVVDGERDVLGSSRSALLAAVAELAARPKGEVRLRSGQAPRTVAVEAAWPEAVAGDLFLALVEAEVVSDVARGENQGRRLVHASVVRSLVLAGEGVGRFQGTVSWPGGDGPGRSLIAFVQAQGGGRILAIGQIDLGGHRSQP